MKLPLTLRTRLVMLVLAAIVPLFGLSVVGSVLTANEAVSRATQNLEFSASLVAANQQRVADSARQLLTAIANTPLVQEGKNTECGRYLKTLNEQALGYANLVIAGLDGYLRCHALGSGPAEFVGDRSYFQEAIARRGFVASGYLRGRVTGKPIIIFAQPVASSQGALTAVAFAAVNLSELSKSVADAPLPKGSRLVITDRQGIVLAANPENSAVIGQKLPGLALQDAVKAGGAGVLEAPDSTGAQQIYAFLPSGKSADSPFFVAVSADRNEVVAPARRRLTLVFLSLTLVAFLGSWIAWMLGGRAIVKPTAEILEATRQFQQGRLDARVSLHSGDKTGEFSQIAAGFNLMADSLQQRQRDLETELARSQHACDTLQQLQLAQAKSYNELRETQRKLLDAQRLGRIGNWELDLASQQLSCSNEVYELFGRAPASFDGRLETMELMIHPEDRAGYLKIRDRAMRDGSALDTEYRIITPAGDVRWINQRGQLQVSEEGQAVCRTGVVQDITGRKQSELALAHSVDLLNRTGEMAMVGGWELILDGMQLVNSEQIYRICERDGTSGLTFADAMAFHEPEARLVLSAAMQAAIDHGTPWGLELPMVTAKGRRIWVRSQGQALKQDDKVVRLVGALQDITERKLAEQSLITSEQRYAALFDMAPVPMWVDDPVTGRFLAANNAAVRAYGYSEEEFRTMNIFDIRPESEQGSLREHLLAAEPVRKEFWQHRRKDGSLFFVNVVSTPIQYAGRAARFVVALDVTAQIKAEKDTQDYLFTLQRAADAAQAITWHQTLEGTMQEIAEQARGVIGAHQTVVSLNGDSHHLPMIHALSLSEKYAAYRGPMEPSDGSGIYAMVCENNRSVRLTQAELEAHSRWRGFGSYADKYPAMRGWLAVPLTGRDGKNIGLLQLSDKYEGEFTKQDEYVALELGHLASAAIENSRLLEEVSQLNAGLEQKVAERTVALARQEALFRALAEQAPQTVWMASPDGAATYVNRAWFDLMGGELKDWTGYQWLAAAHPEDVPDIKANWKISRANQTPYAGIRRMLAKDGSYHTMAYRGSPVFGEQGEVSFWVGIDADITEIKAIEAALRLSNQELEAFSYSVSHDLRSPLNTVDGFSRLLAKQLAPQLANDAGGKATHYLSRIQAGVAQMGQLIEDLLSLSQVTRAQLHTEPVDLSAMAQSLLDEWQARQPERRVAVHVDNGLQAEADGRLVRVALGNLLDNAWKFTSQKAQAEISVGQKIDAAGLPVFFVQDNGAGFDMAYADKLFNPFQRLHAASEFSGTGIGRATVSRVIKRHGGRVWAESAPGGGATFFFTLPRVLHAL